MLIYRIENRLRPQSGAFTGGDCASHACAQARLEGVFVPANHPAPNDDQGLYRWSDINEYCGFQSLEVYRIWFVTPTVRAALYASGTHHMRVYDVPDHLVSVGMVQVLFRLTDATSVRDATPEEIA